MKKTLKKSIAINASKEKVWEVLMNDEYNRQWFSEFSQDTRVETDWSIGSKALYKDNTGSGMVGKIVENKKAELLSLEYMGAIENGKEEYDSEMANAIKGGFEIYKLSEKNGVTDLTISCDMGEDYFDMMSLAWDKALQKIKRLSEA